MTDHARSRELAIRIEAFETAVEAGAFRHWLAANPNADGAVVSRGNAHIIHGSSPDTITRLWGFALGVEPEIGFVDQAIDEARRRDHLKVTFEWNPYMHSALFSALGERGFVVQEFTNCYTLGFPRDLDPPPRRLADGLRLEVLDPHDMPAVDAAGRCWAASIAGEEPPEWLMHVGRIIMGYPQRQVYMAMDGADVAGIGTMAIQDGIAFLNAGATMPSHRAKGVQAHLLHARLAHALEASCEFATIGSDPGTVSQRNVERAGFRCIYTKLTTMLELKPEASSRLIGGMPH